LDVPLTSLLDFYSRDLRRSMGIRFACHVCGKHLNIKRELAGRRGVCPSCTARFRIPLEDAETSAPVESATSAVAQASSAATPATATSPASAALATSFEPDGQLNRIPSDHGDGIDNDVVSDVATDVGGSVASEVSADVNHQDGDDDGGALATERAVPQVRVEPGSLLDDDPAASWYVRPPSGGQYGPATGDVLKQWIEEGRVASTALLWREGWPQWRDASEALPELATQLPNGNVASKVAAPDSGAASLSHPDGAVADVGSTFTGEASVGTERRARSMRRVLLIGVLSAVAVALLGVLAVVINR